MGKHKNYKKYKKNVQKSKSKNKSVVHLANCKVVKEKRMDIALAYFWRYGYWFCLVLIWWICGYSNKENTFLNSKKFFYISFGGAIIVHAIYSIIIAYIPTRYFILGMLDAEHQEMKLAGSNYNKNTLKRWQKEMVQSGVLFIALGLLVILITFW